MSATEIPVAKPAATRVFGRFELRRLLGKSARSMSWLALDPRSGQEVMLTMPRVQPADETALHTWKNDVEQGSRLNHPNLAHVIEIGVHDGWPYVSVDRALGLTLGERLETQRATPTADAVDWTLQMLEGLAFAHQAAVAHGDLQVHQVLVSDQGIVRVMGLAASGLTYSDGAARTRAAAEAPSLRVSRTAAQRDVLTAGLLMHHLLAGAPALDEPDTSKVIDRLPPLGRDIIRLPWTTPQPVAEGLRAIANRTTDRQERHRYHNARTLLRALHGWRDAAAQDAGGPLALLLDRLHTVGHLPARPGVGARVARLAMAEGQRTDEMAEQVLQDMALSFELLRHVNSAQVQGTQASGSAPVLTLRRAIALVGVKGLRQAASSLRPWPGPLSEPHAEALATLMDRVRLAGHTAQALRPAGYDPEVVYLVTLLQNLGRLLVQYHFPDEAQQIRDLMHTLPPVAVGEPDEPGMTEEAASFAVLGIDSESLGAAVARHWGLTDDVLHMVRRLTTQRPVRAADGDGDVLRMVASLANEVVDAVTTLPSTKVGAALTALAQRYARGIELSARDIGEALQAGRAAMKGVAIPPRPTDAVAATVATPAAPRVDVARNVL
ncbi:HDOD domain-containing protein [Rhizobacter sp. LjRoot28]|jgi:non-specific serine/threonine protein kinase|uniref:HDOD domain-containing protein n=1 Tax=Rhizobacter sp. LjRoot28 TaxID=3342309 RepID=UPI003ECEA129